MSLMRSDAQMANEPTWKCPRCKTEYFEELEECDWCPDVRPLPFTPKEAAALEVEEEQ